MHGAGGPRGALKRERSLSEESELTQARFLDDDEAALCAEVLRALKHARWEAEARPAEAPAAQQPSPRESSPAALSAACSPSSADDCDTRSSNSSCDSAAVSACPKPETLARSASTTPKFPTTTRSYVWRGPSRRAHASNGEGSEDAEENDNADGAKNDRDKEWAALTTWLRMNLHQPRTSKRVVLFVGAFSSAERRWVFQLNPELTWDDVSPETKLRLRTLPDETAAAFSHKYPGKVAREWLKKTQKYRAPGSSCTVSVPLGDMIYSMADIYFKHEGSSGPQQQQEPGQQAGATTAQPVQHQQAPALLASAPLPPALQHLPTQQLARTLGLVC